MHGHGCLFGCTVRPGIVPRSNLHVHDFHAHTCVRPACLSAADLYSFDPANFPVRFGMRLFTLDYNKTYLTGPYNDATVGRGSSRPTTRQRVCVGGGGMWPLLVL